MCGWDGADASGGGGGGKGVRHRSRAVVFDFGVHAMREQAPKREQTNISAKNDPKLWSDDETRNPSSNVAIASVGELTDFYSTVLGSHPGRPAPVKIFMYNTIKNRALKFYFPDTTLRGNLENLALTASTQN